MKKDDMIFYVLMAISAVTAIASVLTLNIFIVVMSSILILATAIEYRLWYVIESAIFRHTNIVEIFDGYELSKDRNSAIFRSGGRMSSTTAAMLSTEKDEAIEKADIENIISHADYPFKFVMRVERLNVNKIMDRMQTDRSLKEMEMSRLDPKRASVRISQLKRELEQIEHDISAVRSGNTPIKLVRYILTTSVSDTLYDAEEKAKSQIRELTSQFDALLKSKSRIVTGAELVELMKLDSEMVG